MENMQETKKYYWINASWGIAYVECVCVVGNKKGNDQVVLHEELKGLSGECTATFALHLFSDAKKENGKAIEDKETTKLGAKLFRVELQRVEPMFCPRMDTEQQSSQVQGTPKKPRISM